MRTPLWRGSFLRGYVDLRGLFSGAHRARRGSDGETTQDAITDTTGLGSVRRSGGSRRVAGCGAARGSRRLVGRAGAARNTFDNPRRLF